MACLLPNGRKVTGLGDLCGCVCVCARSCLFLLLAAFRGPVATGFLLLPPHPYSWHPFLVSPDPFFFVVLLMPLPVHTPCLCYHCLLMFSLILSGDFLDFSPFENHSSPFFLEQTHPFAGNCCYFNSILFYHSFCTVEEMEKKVQVTAFHCTV